MLGNFLKSSRVYFFNLCSIDQQQVGHLTSLVESVLKLFWQKLHVAKSLRDRCSEHILFVNCIYFSYFSSYYFFLHINIGYYLEFWLPMCHRQFFRIISQNPEYVKTQCIDGTSPFHFSFRKWYLDNQSL